MEHVDPVKRDEGVQCVKNDRATEHDTAQPEKRDPFVLLRVLGWVRFLCGGFHIHGKTRDLEGEKYSYQNGWKGQKQRSLEAQPEEECGGEERADGKSSLPSNSEKAHGRCLVLRCHVIRSAGCFRVVSRQSKAAENNHKEDEMVTGNNADERNPQSRDEDPRGDKPRLGELVGKITEEGLDE